MKKIIFFVAMLALTACYSSGFMTFDESCLECDQTVRSITFPEAVDEFDLATDGAQIAIVWREKDCEFSPGHLTLFEPDIPPSELASTALEASDSYSVWRPRVDWHLENPRVFWTRYESSNGSLIMAEYDVASSSLHTRTTLYDSDYYSSLRQVVYHPSGEYGLVWSNRESFVSYAQAFFGRFSKDGELIMATKLDDADYSTHPRIDATPRGYSLAFTRHPTYNLFGDVMALDYSLSEGLESPIQLNTEHGRHATSDVAATPSQEAVIWRLQRVPSDDVYQLNISWRKYGMEPLTALLNEAVVDADAIGSSEEQTLIGWCSFDPSTEASKLEIVRLSFPLIEPVFHADLTETGCTSVRLLKFNDQVIAFWLDAEGEKLSYRNLCI